METKQSILLKEGEKFAYLISSICRIETVDYLYELKEVINTYLDNTISDRVDERAAEIESILADYDEKSEQAIKNLVNNRKAEKADFDAITEQKVAELVNSRKAEKADFDAITEQKVAELANSCNAEKARLQDILKDLQELKG